MFNPFYLFTSDLLDAFVKRNKTFFVRQSFPRGRNILDNHTKGYFIISHYEHLNTALDHFGAIAYDANRFLYNWNDPEHQKRLQIAASQPDDYKIYSTVFKPDWDKHISTKVRDKLRMYIKKVGWMPIRMDEVQTNYELQFGELYIRIKWGSREAKIKFEEIEKIY